MNEQDSLIQLLKVTERLGTQMDNIDKRLTKIEAVVTNDIKQDQRLASIEISLGRGNAKFQKIEDRLNKLEQAEGNKAKALWSRVLSYCITAFLGFIIALIGAYFTGGVK